MSRCGTKKEERRKKREERNGFEDHRRLSSNSLSWRPPVAEPQRWSSTKSALLSPFLRSLGERERKRIMNSFLCKLKPE